MKHLAQHHSRLRHLWWLVALAVLLMASYVVAGRQLMSMVPEWRAPLEKMLQQRTGMPLTIGALHGRMEGLTPVLQLDQLVVPAADGDPQHALKVGQVAVAVDLLMSLLHRSVWLRDLSLSGLSLDITQDQDGHFQLRGFPRRAQSAAGKTSLHSLLQLLYQQKQVILDKVDLSLKLNNLPLITTRDARLEMVSSGSHHQLALRLNTEQQPLALDVRLNLDADAFELADLSGAAYVGLAGKDMQYWLPRQLAERLHLQRLSGKLAFWLSLDNGRLDHSSLALQVAELVLAEGDKQWQVQQLHGLVTARYDDGYQVQVRGLDFDTSGGHWHSGTLGGWWNGQQGDAAKWKLRLSDLDLEQLGGQLLHWPFALPDALTKARTKLTELRPQAQLAAFYAEGMGKQVQHFAGRFYQASIQAVGKVPGLSGVSGWFDGSPDKGWAVLDSSQLGLNLPLLYDHAMSLSVAGELRWFHGEAGLLRIETGRWRLANPDGEAELVAGVTLVPQQVPLLHLLADVSSNHIERAGYYLPTRKMPQALSDWLAQNIDGGRLTSGKFLYEGPVHIDKRRQQDRTLQMLFAVSDGNLAFLPGWPPLKNLSGSVLVDGHKVYGHDLAGHIFDSDFSDTSFDVWTQLPDKIPMLLVSGKVEAKASDLGKLLHDTPLAEKLPKELADWQLSQGKATGDLLLQLALKHGVDVPPKVVVQAQLSGATLADDKRRLSFDKVAGDVHFDLQQGISSQQLSANWLGAPLTGKIATADGKLSVDASGQLDMAPLADWLQADWLKLATGKAKASVQLLLPWRSQQPLMLKVNSDLVGVALKLPAPLAKSAAASTPLALTLTDGKRLDIRYDGKPNVSGSLLLDDGALAGGTLRLGAGKVGKPHQPGLLINGSLPALVVEPWVDFFASYKGSDNKKENGQPLARLSLQLGKLEAAGFSVDKAHLDVTPGKPDGWQLQVDSNRLEGKLLIPAGYQLRGDKPLVLDITRLHWPALSKEKQQAASTLSPMDLPVADVNLTNLMLGEENLGSWQGQIRPVQDGVRVQQLQGQWRHTRFDGTLDWIEQQGKQTSHYAGSLGSNDLGAMQQDWNITPLVLSDSAKASIKLGWPGTPLDVDYLTLDGSAQFEVGACRLPHMDNNNPLLRLLGVLNVGSIARRLRFDFSDLYKKGLSCDSIDGKLTFAQEKLAIEKLRLKSPSADITLTGHTNLKTHQLDNDMTVVLPLSSNLYAGCLAGPAACAGIFVFDRLLGKRLEKAAALHYHVSGDWANPVIKEK